MAHLPCGTKASLCVRWCPRLFSLWGGGEKEGGVALPYRMLYAVTTESSVLFYDTEHCEPFALLSNIHYSTLNDLTW